MTLGEVCEHGSLKRQCDRCEMADRIATLERELDRYWERTKLLERELREEMRRPCTCSETVVYLRDRNITLERERAEMERLLRKMLEWAKEPDYDIQLLVEEGDSFLARIDAVAKR